MERPERLIVLIGGAALGLLLPAVAVLAVLANFTALQRIWHTRRAAGALVPAAREASPPAIAPVPDPHPVPTRSLYRRR
jgi:predicted membrane chloride channel (bestrophin family)